MRRAVIVPDKCKNCDVCSVNENCIQKAIIREDGIDKPWVDFYKCRGCMKCKPACANGAVIEETKPCDGGFARSF